MSFKAPFCPAKAPFVSCKAPFQAPAGSLTLMCGVVRTQVIKNCSALSGTPPTRIFLHGPCRGVLIQ
eukprot:1371501-Rhodomonas_salina.1